MSYEVWIVSNMPPPVHGVSVFNDALVRQLDKRCLPHRIFSIGTRGLLEDVERFGVAKLAQDSAQLGRLLASAMRARRRRDRAPVIYFTPSTRGTAVLRDATVARIAAAFAIPLVAHLHGCGWLEEWRRGTRRRSNVMLGTLQQCDAVICLGPSYAELMSKATGARCVGVNNGVDAGSGQPAKRAPGTGRIELLYVSNLMRSKGLWVAANALKELRARNTRAHLRCAGSWLRDAERVEFESEFADELRDGSIELVGFADPATKVALLDQAHFFLLPITNPLEGQPLALIEAMARGCVPITTAHGGIPDLFDFHEWQRLANARHVDPREVADTVTALRDDAATYERFSRDCIQRYASALTVEDCTDRVVQVLQAAHA